MLTGDNGILTQVEGAKEKNTEGMEKEQIQLAMQSVKMDKIAKRVTTMVTAEELQNQLIADGAKNVTVESGELDKLVVNYADSKNSYTVDQDGNIEGKGQIEEETGPVEQPENVAKEWAVIRKTDASWYSYNDVSNGNQKVRVNAPKLGGNMKPIKYVGAEAESQTGSKWANAMTTDGSMWVWIPRYAYKITEGYHTNVAGTIEVAFLDKSNNFLNGEEGKETLTTNPEEEGAGTTKWLVHPAFTSNAANGGGFGEIEGLWVGKFEATGSSSEVSVKPGITSLRNMTINDQYKAAKNATYGESVSLKSHMMKNSEWGATVYLAHSKYGTNKQKVENNGSSEFYTGGTNTVANIYTTNKKQSTTQNATGVYDLNGGADEYVASYVNNGNESLRTYGGTASGDIYGVSEEQSTSTEYKTVYSSENNQSKDYETAGKKNKGDAVYETSSTSFESDGSWFDAGAFFPGENRPFFSCGDERGNEFSGTYKFWHHNGTNLFYTSFRSVLAP